MTPERPERFGVIAARYLAHLARQETTMAAAATASTATHEPIVLVDGDVFCLEGECGHAAEVDDHAAEPAPCPMLDEITACKACSTVTRSVYGDEWGPVVAWPCAVTCDPSRR